MFPKYKVINILNNSYELLSQLMLIDWKLIICQVVNCVLIAVSNEFLLLFFNSHKWNIPETIRLLWQQATLLGKHNTFYYTKWYSEEKQISFWAHKSILFYTTRSSQLQHF